MFTSHTMVTLTASTLSKNTATGGAGGTGGFGQIGFFFGGAGGPGGAGGVGQGAGLYALGGQVGVTNATIALNTATGGAGGAGGNGGSVFFTSGFGGNGGQGGNGGTSAGAGLYVSGGTISLTNDTVASNRAKASTGGAGGIGGFGTFNSGMNGAAGKGKSGQGGGARVTAATTVNAINTLFGLNKAAKAPDFSGNFTTASNNFLGDGTGSNLPPGNPDSTGNIVGTSGAPIDPLLGPLANNGGPTQTMALLAGSPCLDAGTASGAPSTDQRGVSRGTPPDIGAYELEPSATDAAGISLGFPADPALRAALDAVMGGWADADTGHRDDAW
jgi:hypothetical protein